MTVYEYVPFLSLHLPQFSSNNMPRYVLYCTLRYITFYAYNRTKGMNCDSLRYAMPRLTTK